MLQFPLFGKWQEMELVGHQRVDGRGAMVDRIGAMVDRVGAMVDT